MQLTLPQYSAPCLAVVQIRHCPKRLRQATHEKANFTPPNTGLPGLFGSGNGKLLPCKLGVMLALLVCLSSASTALRAIVMDFQGSRNASKTGDLMTVIITVESW